MILLWISIFAMSWEPIFARLSEYEISPLATSFFRESIPITVFGGWVAFQNRFQSGTVEKTDELKSSYSTRLFIVLIVAGTSATLAVVLYTWSLTKTSVANSTVLHSLAPVFTTLGAWLVFSERFSLQFLIGMGIAIVGAISIGAEDLHISLENLQGDLMSLVSVIFYSIYLLAVSKIRAEISTAAILLWRCCIGAVSLFPILLITKDPIFPFSFSGWLSVLALALVNQILAQGLVAYVLESLTAEVVALYFLIIPGLSAILGWLIFAESLSLFNLLSFSIILIGIYLALAGKKPERQ